MMCTAKLINPPELTVPAIPEPEDKGGLKPGGCLLNAIEKQFPNYITGG